MPSDAQLDLERFIPYRLSVVSNQVSGAIASEYAERFNLTIPEWRAMAVLGNTPDLSAREVAERTAMDKVQVSRAVALLLRAGRLEKRPDKDDGRITRLRLTAKGLAIYQQIVPLALSLEKQFLQVLSASERKHFDGVMTKLARQAAEFAR